MLTDPARAKLRECYVILDRVREDVDGMDGWAIDRTTEIVEEALRDADAEATDSEADRLVQQMREAAEAAQEA